MPETIGQHNIAAITAPVNGQPQDANVVRGNDNTIRGGHNNHDNDPGIHLQSSTFALRPAAGVAGRKWVTVDGGSYELWYDDGARWHHVSSGFLLIDAIADANLTAGQVVKVTGFNVGQQLPRVDVVASASDVAFGLVLRDSSPGGIVSIVNTGLVSPIDTNGYAPGTILYSDGAGGLTPTQPSSGSYQACALVLRGNVNNGAVYVEFSEPQTVEATAATPNTLVKRDGSGNIAAVGVNATSVTATNLSGALAAANVQPGTFPNGTFTAQNVTVTGTLTAATIAAVAASAVTAGTFGAGDYTFPASLTIANGLTVDTNVLRVDHTNNRVGVNTATPQQALHVASGTARLDGAVDLSNGVGTIKFLSTGAASSDANTLDAYVEAAWTPDKETGVADTTVTNNGAYFVKVGRLVHVYADISVASTNAIDFMVVEGLPAHAEGAGTLMVRVINSTTGIGSDGTAWTRASVRLVNNDEMYFYYYPSSGNAESIITWSQANGKRIIIYGTYRANN